MLFKDVKNKEDEEKKRKVATYYFYLVFLYISYHSQKIWKLQQLTEPETHLTDTETVLFPDCGFSYASSLFIFSVKIELLRLTVE